MKIKPEELMTVEVLKTAEEVIDELYYKERKLKIYEEALWMTCNKIKKLHQSFADF